MVEPKSSGAFDDALAQIVQISRLSDGLALVILAAPATHTREGLERIAATLTRDREVLWHDLDHRGVDLNETLALAARRPALLVYGLERLVDQERHRVEEGLNLARDSLVTSRALIVFWIDEQLLDEFRRLCPDLFHWRSLLLRLNEDDLRLPAATVELRRYAQHLQEARPVHPHLYFEPQVRPSGERQTVSLSVWAGEVDHGCLVGEPGSGKSIGVAMYAADQARLASEDGGVLPLLLVPARVRAAPTGEDSLTYALRAMAGSVSEMLSSQLLRRRCETGELQIVIDGFDEIPPLDRRLWIDWLDLLRLRHPRIRTLLVSRPHVFRSPEWRQAEVVPWGRETIESFLEQKIPDDRERAELFERLRESRLLEMAGSPILLAFLVRVYRLTGVLPMDRMSLLAAYVDTLLGRETAKHLPDLRSMTSPQTLRRQLATLALELLCRGDDVFQKQDLAGWSDLDEGIRYLASRSGLIQEVSEGTYAFSHRSLLEFFAVEGIVELGAREALPLMLEHREDPLWGDVLTLAVPRLLDLTSERDTDLRGRLAGLPSGDKRLPGR